MPVNEVLGPVVALGALGFIVLLCRWVFSTTTRDARAAARRLAAERARGDYGLLVPVASAPTQQDADVLRDVLRDAGIRGTTAPAPDGRVAVLVFPVDAPRAAQLV